MTTLPIVNSLSVLLILTSLSVVESRRLKVSAYFYSAQSLVLISIFLTLAILSEAEQLYLWSVTALVTKAFLVPFILLRVIRTTGVIEEEPPLIRTTWSLLLAAVMVGIAFVLVQPFHLFAVLKYKTALAVSLAHFLLGLHCMITRRNALKQLLGFCLMENGSHLTLAIMAYNVPKLVEIGILTDAVFGVLIMSLIAKKLHDAFGSMDASQLKMLKG
ncbi:hydrogenase 4 membrane subunit [Calderihabitans maritimus]|uniref:Hydrogenase 4 membrane subunit n=1 Tax=Calderihabitans maritimus TaxID=1246530 RepID=A0A1Z5HP89_9FIRM|nr:hydrogenase 4 membrane subunit [Calderihabitans maritimus]GAW91100.1 hydrogenase 4 membrane subunit [Calderihabitans maritimus]